MNKNRKNAKHHRLALQKETVIHLTEDRLKGVIGGNIDGNNSHPISLCNNQCVAE
jgi:hypothetical protein